MTTVNVSDYDIVRLGGVTEIREVDGPVLGVLAGNAPDSEVRCFLHGYKAGREDGEKRGRGALQHDLQRLLDVPNTYQVSRTGDRIL